MSSWHSYPKIFNLGHSALRELFADPVIVEEKVDGSQFSFGVFDGVLQCKSKNQMIVIDAPEKLFTLAIESVKQRQHLLTDGYTYRAEYLKTPKHNALAYDRIPTGHLIIFDINTAEEQYMSYEDKKAEAERIGLEVVPLVWGGRILDHSIFMSLLDKTSVLGGQKIEGVVVKNYLKFGTDKKALLGKHVSEAFKEVHKGDWAKSNPGKNDVLLLLCEEYRSKARWNKAIQHLAEAGKLENSPKDISNLIGEVQKDIGEECEAEIKDKLYKWAIPHIRRKATAGLPDWYKEKLVELQFNRDKKEVI